MAKFVPRGAQAQLAELKAITTDERNNVVGELDKRWCDHALHNLQRAREATEAGKSFDARNYTWAAGVSTDKVFAIREIPTQIVANLHAHRVNLSSILDKFASASRVLSVHQRKGFQPPSAPVTHSLPLPRET